MLNFYECLQPFLDHLCLIELRKNTCLSLENYDWLKSCKNGGNTPVEPKKTREYTVIFKEYPQTFLVCES